VKSIQVPTSFRDVAFLCLPYRVRLASWVRRALNLRASDTTQAAVQLQFVFLGQEGITEETLVAGSVKMDRILEKPISQMSEREACALIAASRDRLRQRVAEFNAYHPHPKGAA
jgi:hypothetical protein